VPHSVRTGDWPQQPSRSSLLRCFDREIGSPSLPPMKVIGEQNSHRPPGHTQDFFQHHKSEQC